MKFTITLLIIFSTTSLFSFQNAFTIIPLNNPSKIFTENKSIVKITSTNKKFNLKNSSTQIKSKHTQVNGITTITLKIGSLSKKVELNNNLKNELLRDTRLLTINNTKIQIIAKKLKRKNYSMKSLKRWVYNYISTKTEGIPFISAKSVLKLKAGDCTEHTVLTVSILRAMKIPTKAIVGLILEKKYGSHKNIYVMHMWAKAYINKTWQIVDSTRIGKTNSNRYIELADHNLKTEIPLNYLKKMDTFENITIEYIHKQK